MNFKEFLNESLLLEFKEEIAFKTALGGEQKVIADLKSFPGVKNLKVTEEKINVLKEHKRVYFDRIDADVSDWKKLFDYLKSKKYEVFKTYLPGNSIGHYALKNGAYIFEFYANKTPHEGNPFIRVYVVKKLEPISYEEEKHIKIQSLK